MENPLKNKLFGIEFNNPVWTASGTFGFGEEYRQIYNLSALGALVTKTITLNPRDGNPPPRIVETPSGMLNSIGLENIGVKRFIIEKIPFLRQAGTKIVVNIAGFSIDEYGEVASILSDVDGIHLLEVNISCPNVKEGGIAFGSNPSMAGKVTRATRKSTHLPIVLKLSPNVTDITSITHACEDNGADGISLINTLIGMDIDVSTFKPSLANITGGLSGPAIRPIAQRMVFEAARSVSIPVIGIGGITDAYHVLQFLIAGASAVEVGSAVFCEPDIHSRIIEGIREYVENEGLSSINDLIGRIRV